jgi:ribokinase
MLDVSVSTPYLPRSGENLLVPDILFTAGGKGSNAAVALARHQAHVYLIGNVGNDAQGQQLCRELQEAGVDTDLIDHHPATPTGVVVMLAQPGGHTSYLAHSGANQSLTPASVRQRLEPLLPDLDALLFNFEPPAPALHEAVTLADAHNVPIFIDPGPERSEPEYGAALWATAGILCPNEPEAAALIGQPITNDEEALHAARSLQKHGPTAVVIKRGPRGAAWATAGDSGLAPAFATEPLDTAGCGDAFTAGLVWATLAGLPLPTAIRWANACGALTAQRLGTLKTMPTRDEVEAFLEQQNTSYHEEAQRGTEN